jgi:regulator of replication initiation timing
MDSRNAKPAIVNAYSKKTNPNNRNDNSEFPLDIVFPNAEELHEKYGEEFLKSTFAAATESHQQRCVEGGSGSELIDRTEGLIKKLAKKDLEIEKLCILLESLEPIPGLSADSMRKYLDNNVDDGADFRDAKIVALAKKNRNLMVMLNKERASADSRGLQIQELTEKLQQIERLGSSSKRNEPQQDALQLRKEIISLNKSIEDLKRKFSQSVEENKKLARALSNEVGDSVTVEQAVEGTWRGRAQQIIMLKAKIRKLTDDKGLTVTPATAVSGSGSGLMPKAKRNDVDSRAQEELVDMSVERKFVVESIIEERDSLAKITQQLEEKVLAHKARIRNLEADASRQKQQMKVVLDVKDGDDELIDALQQEIQRVKLHSKGKEAPVTYSQPPQEVSAETETIHADLIRLKRLCKSQADQLTTQEGVIRSLRSKLV